MLPTVSVTIPPLPGSQESSKLIASWKPSPNQKQLSLSPKRYFLCKGSQASHIGFQPELFLLGPGERELPRSWLAQDLFASCTYLLRDAVPLEVQNMARPKRWVL